MSTRIEEIKFSRIVGLAVERGPAAGYFLSDEYHESDTGLKYKRSVDATGTPEWALFGYSGGSLSGKYWVSDDGLSPYPTAASAIAAAIFDGHGIADPAEIIFLPGLYAGGFSLPAGISLTGIQRGESDTVTLFGPITFAPAGGVGEVHTISNLRITAGAGLRAIEFGGTGRATLLLSNVRLESVDKACISVTNTHAQSRLRMLGSRLTSNTSPLADAALVVFDPGVTMAFDFEDTDILPSSTGDRAIEYQDLPFNDLFMRRLNVFGQIRLAKGRGFLEYTKIETFGVDSVAWDFGQVFASFCYINTKGVGARPFATISGALSPGGLFAFCEYQNNREIDPFIGQLSSQFIARPRFIDSVNDVVTSVAFPCDVIKADTTVAGFGTTLPDIRKCPVNHRITVFLFAGLNALGVFPNAVAGDTMIDSAGGAGPVVLPTMGASAEFIADTGTQTWMQIT